MSNLILLWLECTWYDSTPFKLTKTFFLWPTLLSILWMFPCTWKMGVLPLLRMVFHKCLLGQVGTVVEILYILTDFVPICFISVWEKDIYISNHDGGFVYFSINFCFTYLRSSLFLGACVFKMYLFMNLNLLIIIKFPFLYLIVFFLKSTLILI